MRDGHVHAVRVLNYTDLQALLQFKHTTLVGHDLHFFNWW